MHERSRRRDPEEAVSEIVGALLLVVVVSSAAFGFGVFLHQQQKETQRQQALELAIKLEKVDIEGLLPSAAADPCATTPAPAGAWTSLSLTLVNRHLSATTVTQVMLSKSVVHRLELSPFDGSRVVDFSLTPTDPAYVPFVLAAGERVEARLPHLSCTDADAVLFSPPALGLQQDAPLQVEVLTALGNHVERVFTPPIAIATVEPVAGASHGYVLVGATSEPGDAQSTLTRYDWEYWATTCGAPGTGMAAHGHRAQVDLTALAGGDVCARLTVTDNHGLSGSATVTITVPA